MSVLFQQQSLDHKSPHLNDDVFNFSAISAVNFSKIDVTITLAAEKLHFRMDSDNFEVYEEKVLDCKDNLQTTVVEEQFVWTSNSTHLLLDLRLAAEDQFNNPACKKQQLWNTIAEQFNAEGFSISGHTCDKKYRNLLATYRVNKKKLEQNPDTCITWEYFQKFDVILGNKDSTFPQKELLGSSLTFNVDSTELSTTKQPVLHVDIPMLEIEGNEMTQEIKESENIQIYRTEIVDTKENFRTNSIVEEQFVWTSKSTHLLVDLRLAAEDQFERPTCRKQNLWNNIAQQFNAEGYNITGHTCDKKYRNLLATYRANKRKQENGEVCITWEFFQKFDEVLGHKYANSQRKEFLETTLNFDIDTTGPSSSTAAVINLDDDDISIIQIEGVDGSQTVQEEKCKKEKMTRADYYRMKLEFMKKRERKRLELKENHFRRKEALELERLNAINKLAAAILHSSKKK